METCHVFDTSVIQEVFLSHPEHGNLALNGFPKTIKGNTESVEVCFPYDPLKNEELMNIWLGVDYTISAKDAPAVKLIVEADGSYHTNAAAKILVKDTAFAVAEDENGAISVQTGNHPPGDRVLIYNSKEDKFLRGKNVSREAIAVYRVNCEYPRWVDNAMEDINVGKGIKKEEQRLDYIFLQTLCIDSYEGRKAFRYNKYIAHIKYIPKAERKGLYPYDDMLRLSFHNLELETTKLIVPDGKPATSKA